MEELWLGCKKMGVSTRQYVLKQPLTTWKGILEHTSNCILIKDYLDKL